MFAGDVITKGPASVEVCHSRAHGLHGAGRSHACSPLRRMFAALPGVRAPKPAHSSRVRAQPAAPTAPQALRASRKLKAHVARGNNDDGALAAYYAYRQAGDQPAPKFSFVKDMTNSDADYVAGLPFTVSLPEYGVCVAHGGAERRMRSRTPAPAYMRSAGVRRCLLVRRHAYSRGRPPRPSRAPARPRAWGAAGAPRPVGGVHRPRPVPACKRAVR